MASNTGSVSNFDFNSTNNNLSSFPLMLTNAMPSHSLSLNLELRLWVKQHMAFVRF